MAAPTSVRVESNSISTTIIRWSYGGSNPIAVFRSTDGSSYSEITSLTGNTRVASGTTSYTDTNLAAGTKYYYKLSDDGGSTFSSAVIVITQSCNGPVSQGNSTLALQPFTDDEVKDAVGDQSDVPSFSAANSDLVDHLNDMTRLIEAALNGQNVAPNKCVACPTDGAVVIDCSTGCNNWLVVAATNINSVSIQWCDKFDGTIDFVIPPNATVGICGIPAGFGFSGDECFQAPISGGANGRTLSLGYGNGGIAAGGGPTSRPSTNSGIGSGSGTGAGGGGSGCTCVPNNGALTIKSCNANNSLNCDSTKSLQLMVCGGRGPYTWTKSGSVTLQGPTGSAGATAKGSRVTVRPPTNSGSAIAGTAYTRGICAISEAHSGGSTHGGGASWALYKCDDSFILCNATFGGGSPVSGVAYLSDTQECSIHSGHPVSGCTGVSSVSCGCTGGTGTECATAKKCGTVQDRRDAGMISGGCNPCALQEGTTVTVTDNFGAQTTIILKA